MPAVQNALSSSLSGIQRGLASAAARAERIAGGFTEENAETAVSDLIGFKLDLYQVGANRKVAKITRELDESTLDIIA